MDKLIQALQILLKYGNPDYPTHCEHDSLYICGIDPKIVTEEDKASLKELGFFVTDEFGSDSPQFKSYKYGSA